MADVVKRSAVPLDQTSALITGGTAGVGLSTAIHLAEAGVPRIAINGRDVARGEAARSAILAKAPKAEVIFVAGDCNEVDQAKQVCDTTQSRFGSIDLLLNSTVGPFGPKLFHKTPLEDVPQIVIKQMMAPLITCRLVWDGMRERGTGCIINIASDAAKIATPGEAVIGAAMAAIVMFSRTLALEGKRDGIRVNALTPSIIENTMNYSRVMSDEFSSKLFGKAMKMAQLGVVQPEDLAAVVVFLASPEAARLTGQAISINGGISAA